MSADAVVAALRRCAVVVPAAAALVAGAAACSGTASGASDGAHTAFVARVNAVCQLAVDHHAGHDFPFPAFDPEHPDRAELPTVGKYFAHYGGLLTLSQRLHELTPPPPDVKSWRQLLTLTDMLENNASAQIRAAEAKQVPAFVRTVKESNRLVAEINRIGGKFGITSRSACGQVFG